MSKERPILFSTPMVKAILDGRKTETRRIIKPQPIWNVEEDGNIYQGNHKGYIKVDGHPNWRELFVSEFCTHEVGDILWVKETFREYYEPNGNPNEPLIAYKADDNASPDKWRPSLFMPKYIARIWNLIKSVHIEKLQDITEAGALAEGIPFYKSSTGDDLYYKDYMADSKGYGHPEYDYPTVSTAVESFKTLWQSINGIESWEVNPWVWVIKYKVLSTIGKPQNI